MRRPVPAASLRCQIADEIIALNWHHPTARPFHNDVFDPVLKRMKGSEDMIDINIYFLHQATNYGCRRRFNQTGLTSSIVRPSLPAASRNSASRRSPQQIGFIPAQDVPDACSKCKSLAAVCVLPTPVSVPVMKRLTRPVSQAPIFRSHDLL